MRIIKQLANGTRDSMKSLSYELESLIYLNVKENFPANWNQRNITRSLFSDLKKLFQGKTIYTPGDTIKTAWNLYERKEVQEDMFGEIAIVVNVSYHDGQSARGVVFYDTAEKDSGKNTFSNLHKNNYRRLLSVSPHSQLLLLDYDTITGMAFPSTAESIIGNQPHSWNNWIPYTHAVTVPANLALSLDVKTTSLYKVSLPLSYQIGYRYLFGLDLDYSATAIETAAGIKTAKGNSRFLICVAVSHGGSEPDTGFDLNQEMYVEFD
jgi:hypothetical protein